MDKDSLFQNEITFQSYFFALLIKEKLYMAIITPQMGAIMAAFAINIPKGNENTARIDFILHENHNLERNKLYIIKFPNANFKFECLSLIKMITTKIVSFFMTAITTIFPPFMTLFQSLQW